MHTDDMELSACSVLKFDIACSSSSSQGDANDDSLGLASDCQMEYGYKQTLTFFPFQNNCCTLLVKKPTNDLPAKGQLVVSKVMKDLDHHDQTSKTNKSTASELCRIQLQIGEEVSEDTKDDRQMTPTTAAPLLWTSMVAHTVQLNYHGPADDEDEMLVTKNEHDEGKKSNVDKCDNSSTIAAAAVDISEPSLPPVPKKQSYYRLSNDLYSKTKDELEQALENSREILL